MVVGNQNTGTTSHYLALLLGTRIVKIVGAKAYG